MANPKNDSQGRFRPRPRGQRHLRGRRRYPGRVQRLEILLRDSDLQRLDTLRTMEAEEAGETRRLARSSLIFRLLLEEFKRKGIATPDDDYRGFQHSAEMPYEVKRRQGELMNEKKRTHALQRLAVRLERRREKERRRPPR